MQQAVPVAADGSAEDPRPSITAKRERPAEQEARDM